MKDLFCNECNLSTQIPQFIAEKLLGIDNLPLLDARYEQMRNCYDYSYPQWQSVFTEGLKPFDGYDDTTAVTMPIKHPTFKTDFEELDKGAIGVDLPTWFNIQSSNPRIMLIAQDPLRNQESYGECRDAVLSSPFGLHDATHRGWKRGGMMVYELVSRLVMAGYGVYITDSRKYFVYNPVTTNRFARLHKKEYADILKKEIEIVRPTLCVALGRKAAHIMASFVAENSDLPPYYIPLPHLSGAARGAIKQKFERLQEIKLTYDNIADEYAKIITAIIEHIK